MFRFLRGRRAQIRGIDFSLAMIIFLLTLTQILALTNNFIESSRQFQSSQERNSFTSSISQQILSSQGDLAGNDWLNIPTSAINSQPSWNFGLTTNGIIDPFKLNRLSNWSLNDYSLNYTTIEKGLNLQNKKFQIEISNPIKIKIINVNSTDLTSVNVVGYVQKDNLYVSNSQVWIYGFNNLNNIIQTNVLTNDTGYFSGFLNLGAGTSQIIIISIAKVGNNGDSDIYFQPSASNLTPVKLSIFENTTFSNGYGVNVTAELGQTNNLPRITAFYPGTISGMANYTSIEGGNFAANPSNTEWTIGNMSIPANGIVFFLFQEFQGSNLVNYGFVNFPTTIDGYISNKITPTPIPTSPSSTIITTILAREMIMNFKLTVWGD